MSPSTSYPPNMRRIISGKQRFFPPKHLDVGKRLATCAWRNAPNALVFRCLTILGTSRSHGALLHVYCTLLAPNSLSIATDTLAVSLHADQCDAHVVPLGSS